MRHHKNKNAKSHKVKLPKRSIKGAALVEYVLMVGFISAVAIGSVFETGKTVRCIYEWAAAELGSDIERHCPPGEWAASDDTGSDGEGSGSEGGPVTPEPVVQPPLVAFDDSEIDESEYSSTSLTVTNIEEFDEIDVVVSQGSASVSLQGTSAGTSHQFTDVDLSSFSRGTITAVATVTQGGEVSDSAPATALIDLPMMIVPNTLVHNSGFGMEVVMTSDRIYVGAPYEDLPSGSQTYDGRVYVFDRTDGTQLFTIDPDTSRDAYNFGLIMAQAGNYLAITSQEGSGNDFVSVYDLDGNYLFDVDEDPATDNENYFGRELQIEGTTLLVGDQLHTFGVGHMGGIHAFDLSNGGAFMWSASYSGSVGAGSRFDTDGSILVATNWSEDGVTFWDMSDGSFIATKSAIDAQRENIEIVGDYLLYGDNPSSEMYVRYLDPYGYAYELDLPRYQNLTNVYEQAGNLVLINGGAESLVTVFDPATRTAVNEIRFPDTMPSVLPGFGTGMSYQGGSVAIGAQNHQPNYDGVRSGAVYLMPMP
jgi:Flp pilus assembly pilin Flp